MNVFSYILNEEEIDSEPALDATQFVVDDNIGEAVHIHYRNVRFEFSIDEFIEFAENCETAMTEVTDGNR